MEEIFIKVGQFDKIVTVSFYKDSKANKLFGDYICGLFLYTPQERTFLQVRLENDNYIRTDGFVKFKVLYPKDIDIKLKSQLSHEGIKASEIIEILQSNESPDNLFIETSQRQLTNSIKIKVDFSDIDLDEMFLYNINTRIERGEKLIPNESCKYDAIMLRKLESIIQPIDLEIFNKLQKESTNNEFRFEYLKSKFLKDNLSNEETKEFKIRTSSLFRMRINLIKKELQRSSENLKEIGNVYGNELLKIMEIAKTFEPERLNNGKFPVWWDFERFVHIFMRHVRETHIGDRFEEKTLFQYKFEDITRLVEKVISIIDDEIFEHFTINPTKEFKKIGQASIYYNGDYYEIQVAPDGRLMRFHKKECKALN